MLLVERRIPPRIVTRDLQVARTNTPLKVGRIPICLLLSPSIQNYLHVLFWYRDAFSRQINIYEVPITTAESTVFSLLEINYVLTSICFVRYDFSIPLVL